MTLIRLVEIEELIAQLQKIVSELKRRNRLSDSREVDEFFYLHKIEELKLLKNKLEILHLGISNMNDHVTKNFVQICKTLRRDCGYLEIHINVDVCERFSS